MHVPKRNAHTPFSPLHPCRTTDSTSDVSDDSVSYLRPSTMAPASNRTHRLRGGGDTTFTIPDNPSSHDLLAAVFTFCASDGIPPPPASVVDSIINPTSVGNRIAAVQTVLSSEHAQTPVTLSSDQLEAILRIPLSPSPSMPVVDVITLRSDVSTNVYRQHHASPLPHRPLSPPPLSQPAPTSPRPPLLLLPRSSASPLLPLSTAKPKESELCSSTRSQPLTFSKLPSQTATRYHCREGLRYFSEQERLVHLEWEQQQDGHLHVLFRRGPQGRFSFGW